MPQNMSLAQYKNDFRHLRMQLWLHNELLQNMRIHLPIKQHLPRGIQQMCLQLQLRNGKRKMFAMRQWTILQQRNI